MKLTETQTKVIRSSHGWTGETLTTVKDQTYMISTSKTYSGQLVSTARPVNARRTDTAVITSFSVFDKKNKTLINTRPAKVTEKAVKEQQVKAVLLFDEMVQAGEIEAVKEAKLVKGTILFLDGYGKTKGSDNNKHVIYKIENTEYGVKYYTVEIDSLELSVKDYVKPWADKFGIGVYFDPDYRFEGTEEELNNLLIDAHELKKVKDKEAAEANRRAKLIQEQRDSYLSQFKPADRRKTTNIIKAHISKTWPIVCKVEVSTDVFSGGDSMHVKYHSPEKLEELEGFINNFQEGHFNGMEDIYEYNSNKAEIILDGHILQTYKYVTARHEVCEPRTETKPQQNSFKGLEIIVYSDKAIAVIGDTKPVKEQLKALGGSFNFRLSCGPGWIFPKHKREEIEKEFDL